MTSSAGAASVRMAARSVPSVMGRGFRDAWYDIMQLPDGNIGVSVGRAVGR